MPATVTEKTFLKWPTGGVLGYKTREGENGEKLIDVVWCRTCSKHVNKIKANSKQSGAADIDAFVQGTSFVTRYTILRHIDKSKGHKLGLEYEDLENQALNRAKRPGGPIVIDSYVDDDDQSASARPTPSTGSSSSGSASGPGGKRQRRVDELIHTQAHEAYGKMFKTAYLLACDGLPLNKFKTLTAIQKANGVKLIHGCDSAGKAKEFIGYIADAIRDKIGVLVASAAAFSLLSDGSQARKTGMEKELIFVRIVRCGIPIYYCIALQDIPGDSTAENIKRAIDQVISLVKSCRCPRIYLPAVVSVCVYNNGLIQG